MAISYSTGLAKALLARQTAAYISRTDISATDNGSGEDYIATAAGDFIAAGFRLNMPVWISGFTAAGDNITATVITALTATQMSFLSGTLTATEAAGNQVSVFAPDGGSWANLFNGGSITYFGNAASSRPRDAVSGLISADAAVPYTYAGVSYPSTKLIQFDDIKMSPTPVYDSVRGMWYVDLAESIVSSYVASGVCTWYRVSAAQHVAIQLSASTDAIRFDGTIGTASPFDIVMSAGTTVASGSPGSVSSYRFYEMFRL